jgi:hypothetical protein
MEETMIRKLVTRLAVIGSLVLVFGVSGVALAKSATVTEIGIEIKTETCAVGVKLSDDSVYQFTGTFKGETSTSGNIVFQCTGKLEGDAPSRAITASNSEFSFTCFDIQNRQFVVAKKWEMHITPSGNATYKCNAKGQ